jgi:hypothetical protein
MPKNKTEEQYECNGKIRIFFKTGRNGALRLQAQNSMLGFSPMSMITETFQG